MMEPMESHGVTFLKGTCCERIAATRLMESIDSVANPKKELKQTFQPANLPPKQANKLLCIMKGALGRCVVQRSKASMN